MRDLVYPNFKGNSLLGVPNSVLDHFKVSTKKNILPKKIWEPIKDCKKIVLFFIDGFGFNIYKKFALKYPFFKLLKDKGRVHLATTVFPSTTAAGLTTVHSGLSPKEHGLLEWHLYIKKRDTIIETLPYRAVKIKGRKIISPSRDYKILFRDSTVYERLNRKRVKTFVFVPKELSHTVYTKILTKGARVLSYEKLSDLYIALVENLIKSEQIYCFVYLPQIDKAEHTFGIFSHEVNETIQLIADTLKSQFIEKLNPDVANKTGILITSDHGQIDINPKKTIYLNEMGGIVDNFKTSKNNTQILPTGNLRDTFLHIKEDEINQTASILRKKLKGRAIVLKIDKKLINKVFGDFNAHPDFMSRLGNIIILPASPNIAWYKYNERKKINYLAHHGGLSADEMHIPLIVTKAEDLG